VLKRSQRFTTNKQVVRDLQCEAIHKHLAARLGRLSYFGLPSSSLDDVKQWNPLLERITAAERGEVGKDWVLQHELLLNAFKLGLSRKLTLLRGDIDQILITGGDAYGNRPEWPYDIVSLDYSGGLFYRDSAGQPTRLHAIRRVCEHESRAGATDFVLFLSFNLDQIDQHEVRESLKVIRRDLKRFGQAADEVIDAYLRHPKEQGRLKLYTLHLISQLAVQANFESEGDSPILYLGNKDIEMMAFRFYLKKSSRTFAPRLPRERLNQIVNKRMVEIVNGKQVATNLGLPLLREEKPNVD
jgi:hypothetical protein